MLEAEDSERMSVLLSHHLDTVLTGSPEKVAIKRRGLLIQEYIENTFDNTLPMDIFNGGSRSEGIDMTGSDMDTMYIDKNVVVTYPGRSIHSNTDTTVLYMVDAEDCRPGYVSLQLVYLGNPHTPMLLNSRVPKGDAVFISSDIYREGFGKFCSDEMESDFTSNGPSSTVDIQGETNDTVFSFLCNIWPKEAKEWILRPRVYGWPSPSLIDTIINNGCTVVPVGDKCSLDTRLQWRISFVTAERRLIHSLSHIQFKVYCLLKYFLKQIKPTLGEVIGDDDIMCSYFLKTAIFFAVENSHQAFWQEKNVFVCFWFCFNMLIGWVKTGFCPNYFIRTNNMFQRKIHGQNQQRLADLLTEIHQRKFLCLSIRGCFEPLLPHLCDPEVQVELIRHKTAQEIEYKNDMVALLTVGNSIAIVPGSAIAGTLGLLLKSQSEFDHAITYYNIVCQLSALATETYPDDTVATDNKTRYQSLKTCKHWLIPRAALGTDMLYLATFHFQVGNYRKALEMSNHIVAQQSYYMGAAVEIKSEQKAKYMHHYCGQEYTLIRKIKECITRRISFSKESRLCVPHLQLELEKIPVNIHLPPLPYAVFLSFLCCHEIGDTSGRDAALRNLIVLKYDDQQGGDSHWIVHTFVGICHQTVGDYRRAIRAYLDSHRTQSLDSEFNPAMERIEAL